MNIERPRRYALAVELTSHCNQHCGYCYNDWRADNGKTVGALSTDTLRQRLAQALKEVEFDHVTLTGGEPFARKDIFNILDVCKAADVPVHFISNGGLITESIAQRLRDYAIVAIQITLNGPTPEVHHAHVGGNHWQATLEGIAHLRHHAVPVSGSIVITRKNATLVGETLDLFHELGVTSIALSRFSPAGFAARNVAELLASRSEMINALTQAQVRGQQGMDLQVTMPVPLCVIDHADFPNIRFGGCPIGTEMQEFVLGPQGEVRLCTLHKEHLGNTRDTSFATLVNAPQVAAYRDVVPEFCAPCPHQRDCLGGCGAAAASVLGDARRLDPFVAQHVDAAFSQRLQAERRVHLPVQS